jgi:hypothetical protein
MGEKTNNSLGAAIQAAEVAAAAPDWMNRYSTVCSGAGK